MGGLAHVLGRLGDAAGRISHRVGLDGVLLIHVEQEPGDDGHQGQADDHRDDGACAAAAALDHDAVGAAVIGFHGPLGRHAVGPLGHSFGRHVALLCLAVRNRAAGCEVPELTRLPGGDRVVTRPAATAITRAQ